MVIFSSHAHFNIILMLISLAAGGFIQSFYIPVIYSLSTELYPTEIRGVGQGISVGGIRVAGIIGIFGGTLLLTYYKVPGMLLTYAAICFAATIVTVVWMGKKVETNQKELEQISDKFEKSQN
jgi:MFS family permease